MASLKRVDETVVVHYVIAVVALEGTPNLRVPEVTHNGPLSRLGWNLPGVLERAKNVIFGVVAVFEPLSCFDNDGLFAEFWHRSTQVTGQVIAGRGDTKFGALGQRPETADELVSACELVAGGQGAVGIFDVGGQLSHELKGGEVQRALNLACFEHGPVAGDIVSDLAEAILGLRVEVNGRSAYSNGDGLWRHRFYCQ